MLAFLFWCVCLPIRLLKFVGTSKKPPFYLSALLSCRRKMNPRTFSEELSSQVYLLRCSSKKKRLQTQCIWTAAYFHNSHREVNILFPTLVSAVAFLFFFIDKPDVSINSNFCQTKPCFLKRPDTHLRITYETLKRRSSDIQRHYEHRKGGQIFHSQYRTGFGEKYSEVDFSTETKCHHLSAMQLESHVQPCFYFTLTTVKRIIQPTPPMGLFPQKTCVRQKKKHRLE